MSDKPHLSEFRVSAVKRYVAYLIAGVAILAAVLIPPFFHWSQQKDTWLSARATAIDAGEMSARQALGGLAAYYKLNDQKDRSAAVHLSLDDEDLIELTDWRNDALTQGYLTSRHKRQLPAIVTVDGRRMNASVRLRGNRLDHLSGDKWSLKVHLKQGARFNGLRRFSLQAPYTRSFQSEAIIADAMRKVGVLAPRIDYVDLVINGDSIGIMQITEEFDTPLLESQGRRFGPMLQLDDSHTWELVRATERYTQIRSNFSNESSNDRERFDQRAWWSLYSGWQSASPKAYGKYGKRKKREDLNVALSQWMAFTGNQIKPSEIFDIDAFVDFYIVCEYFTAHNLAQWINLRLHYNTLTARLEPIAYDADLNFQSMRGQLTRDAPLSCLNPRNKLARTLMQDRTFAAQWINRIRELNEIIASDQFANFISERDRYYRSKLAADYPWLAEFDFSMAKQHCQRLCSLNMDNFRLPIRGKRPLPKAQGVSLDDLPPIVTIYVAEDERGPYLSLRNRIHAEVVVESLAYENPISEQVAPLIVQREAGNVEAGQRPSQVPVTLSPARAHYLTTRATSRAKTDTAAAQTWLRLDLAGATLTAEDRLSVQITVEGLGTQRTVVKPLPLPPRTESYRPIPVDKLIQRYSFFTPDESGDVLKLAAGQWRIDELVILPRDIDLIVSAGTTVLFAPGAGLVLNGNLTVNGDVSAPVIFDAADTASGWYGIFSHGVGKQISIKHATINATRGFEVPGWRQPAGLLFHRANVDLENVNVTNSCADDAINLIRSNVKIKRSQITNSCIDALDIDASSGSLSQLDLNQAGGDLLDISDSTVSLTDSAFAGAGDKAISVGEASVVQISEARLSDSTIGLAVKDFSEVTIYQAKFALLDIGLMAFQKKAEYGPASIAGSELVIDAEQRYVVEQGSRIVLDGEELPSTPFDLSDYY